jgi:colanic acid/amylovoran biosynthesis glycosyltransferase
VKRILEKIYLNATLLKLDVDWLHFGFATMTLERELVAKAIGAKMGVSFRGFDINVYPLKHSKCYNKLWKYVDAVHSISIDLWNKACDLGLSPSKPYQIIPPAVDAGIILKSILDKKAHDPVEIITIARLHYIKGIDILIDTAKILKDEGWDFIWRVIGSGDSQSLKRYKYHILSLGLEEIIVLEGKKSHEDSLKLLEESDLYVQTSYTEGFCNALLEAQAKGILCVAFNSGGIPENIIHNKTGFLVDSFSENELAKQVKEAIELNPEAKMKMTQQAINRVRADFTLEKQQEAFLCFFSTII